MDMLHHGSAGPFPLRNDPGVRVVKPVVVKATLSPARGAGVTQLKLACLIQHIPQSGKGDPLVGCLAKQFCQKGWSFEPPMTEQFSIERSHQQRVRHHGLFQLLQLDSTSL